MPEERVTFLLRLMDELEEIVLMEATGLYDASNNVRVALTVTSSGLLIFAHILYVDPEICFNPNDAVIQALVGGVSAELSAYAGAAIIMHISSARAKHKTFLFITTSKKEFMGYPKINRHCRPIENPFVNIII